MNVIEGNFLFSVEEVVTETQTAVIKSCLGNANKLRLTSQVLAVDAQMNVTVEIVDHDGNLKAFSGKGLFVVDEDSEEVIFNNGKVIVAISTIFERIDFYIKVGALDILEFFSWKVGGLIGEKIK